MLSVEKHSDAIAITIAARAIKSANGTELLST